VGCGQPLRQIGVEDGRDAVPQARADPGRRVGIARLPRSAGRWDFAPRPSAMDHGEHALQLARPSRRPNPLLYEPGLVDDEYSAALVSQMLHDVGAQLVAHPPPRPSRRHSRGAASLGAHPRPAPRRAANHSRVRCASAAPPGSAGHIPYARHRRWRRGCGAAGVHAVRPLRIRAEESVGYRTTPRQRGRWDSSSSCPQVQAVTSRLPVTKHAL
jgi:hypothetical protein